MPELPEVETIRLGLQKKIVGLKIKKIEVLTPKSVLGDVREIQGRKIFNVWRRAKILGIDLGNITLLFHLKMTGQLIWVGDERFIGGHPTFNMVGPLPNSSTRVIFTFSDDSKLYFNDQRRFGWVKVIRDIQSIHGILGNLGPEPLNKDFSWKILKNNLLKRKSLAIKVVLMDQTLISGIGNIYASEACFRAGIDPRTRVVTLTDKQFQALYHGIVRVLRDGIKFGGATRAHFVDSEGHKGYFLDYAKVYGKDKHSCSCGETIKKIQLGGRGTYFCSSCQR